MEKKDEEITLAVNADGIEGKLTIKNCNSKVLASLGDVLVDKLNWYRWSNALSFFDKYTTLKSNRILEGKETPLPPKYLFEILENAFVEEEDVLQELWAKLLIGWQNPERRSDMRPIYISMIKSFTPTEARIIELVAQDLVVLKNSSQHTYGFVTEDFDFSKIGYFISKNRIIKELQIDEKEYNISVLNLFRCMCFEAVKVPITRLKVGSLFPTTMDFGIDLIMPTTLGVNLMNCCLVV